MDKETRNTLRNAVTQCRRTLEEAVGERLEGQYGIHASGKIEADAHMGHLSAQDADYRAQLLVHVGHIQAGGYTAKEAVAQLVREVAFTHLNRLVAYKMMERRGLIREAVSRGVKSQGFLFYLADHPEDEALWTGGEPETAYRHFLEWLARTFAEEIRPLFAPHDPANPLFPPPRALDEVLALLNAPELADIWDEDETIGWVYQYFTPNELRRAARAASSAPRNSYELAFRNQFYTPRYVVEFLSDNTLGRIWYEMRQGDTRLTEQCRYLVRRPNEVFLANGEEAPVISEQSAVDSEQSSIVNHQSSMVYVPFRRKKDPRQLKILDPAGGSGHFMLYCFDLLVTIYEEAYDDPQLGPRLRADYPTLADLRRALPGLILRHNLHLIDIDRRATQIAALALWLRAQRAYQEWQIPAEQRPPIRKANIVCAEPMPGDKTLLAEFVGGLNPPLLGQLVEKVFAKMTLAGEAGSLLKIEVELREAIAEAKREWEELQTGVKGKQMALFAAEPQPEQLGFDLSGISDAEFWDKAEGLVLQALADYAAQAANGKGLARQLFAEDAVQGFGFIDLWQKQFDVVLMNPPFGKASKHSKTFLDRSYPHTKNDLYAAFTERGLNILLDNGILGAITSRTGFFLTTFKEWREVILSEKAEIQIVTDLGENVLDEATVETAAYCVKRSSPKNNTPFIRALRFHEEGKPNVLEAAISSLNSGKAHESLFTNFIADFKLLPDMPFVYWIPRHIRARLASHPSFEPTAAKVRVGLQTGDDPRFVRLLWEVRPHDYYFCYYPSDGEMFCRFDDPIAIAFKARQRKGIQKWAFHVKSGVSQPWFSPITLLINWEDDAAELRKFPKATLRSPIYYFRPGFSWTRRAVRFIPYAIPTGCVPTVSRYMAYPELGKIFATVGVAASNCASAFLRFYGEWFTRPNYLVENVKVVPWPPVPNALQNELENLVAREVSKRRRAYQNLEPFQEFTAPPTLFPIKQGTNTLGFDPNHLLKQEIEDKVAKAYGLTKQEQTQLELDLMEAISHQYQTNNADDEDDIENQVVEITYLIEQQLILSYLVGCTFGRWDVRIGCNPSLAPIMPGPFDPLPVCPPGMLLGPNGLPAISSHIVSEEWLRSRASAITLPPENAVLRPIISDSEYPFPIDWDGILVDDPDHPDDIVRRVQQVLAVIWGERATAIEREACVILGVKELRDYFRKAGKGGFWDDHVKRYTKSRRKAPIYWLLQSSKGNYALWLYYHRLDKDIYYKALVNYVEPKLRLEENKLSQLQSQRATFGTGGVEAKQMEKEIARQEALLSELRDFHDKLRAVAHLNLDPDLNDGVILNIAPLHQLVPWKEAAMMWDELQTGKHEWSSIGEQIVTKSKPNR